MGVEKILGLFSSLGQTFGTGAINNYFTKELNEENAALNQHYWDLQAQRQFQLNEKAADNAQKRTIDLYQLLQSPSAMVKQLKEAGLNPALMYSQGGMGGHVSSGAQGGSNGGNGAPTLGLQELIDPLTSAQIANINADTRKKESDTKLTESQTKTQELINEFKELENTFNNETYGYRFQKYVANTTSAVEQANIDRINGKISEETFEKQIETIGQNLILLKAKESLLNSQKKLTEEQINEVLSKINLMSAQIWELSSKAELNEEELNKLVNDREWNYISITDAKWIAEQSIDILKEILNFIPIGKAKTLIQKIIKQKSDGTHEVITKKTTQQ